MMNKLNAPLNEAEIRLDDTSRMLVESGSAGNFGNSEDWPVQPTVYAGFHWMADGFFDGLFDKKPTMDMPRR